MTLKDSSDEYRELKKRAELALKDPKLVEIAKAAPLNARKQPNLTWAYKESFKYAVEKITDLKTAEELAISTRFLTKIRRDFPNDFEPLLCAAEIIIKESGPAKETVKEVPKPPEKKRFDRMEFEIPNFAELITKEILEPDYQRFFTQSTPRKKRFIRFSSDYNSSFKTYVREFCLEILDALTEEDFLEKKICIEQLVEMLEKKGLTIKICRNCDNWQKLDEPVFGYEGYCELSKVRQHPSDNCFYTDGLDKFSGHSTWIPKKNSGEKR